MIFSGECDTIVTHNAVNAVAPKTVIDKLQRKFDHGLTSLLHDELHWLDVTERVTYTKWVS